MAQTLEAIKGGGGSIKVGSTGTISVLMSRELQKYASQNQESSAHNSSEPSSLTPSEAANLKKLKPKVSADDASSSSVSSNVNHKKPEMTRKPKHQARKSQIPILDSDNISIDGTPIRAKPKKKKKGSYVVEVVDIKCGSPDRAWATPITNRLKKLGFSKLSENVSPNPN